MLSTHGLTVQATSLASWLACHVPWYPRESPWESYDHVLLYVQPRLQIRDRPRGSPKVDFRIWCWYSGAKSWAELLIWAYSPPMGLYRTAIVQGLSSTHGPEGGRKNRQSFWTFNAVTLKDRLARYVLWPHVHKLCVRCCARYRPRWGRLRQGVPAQVSKCRCHQEGAVPCSPATSRAMA